jgi:hypothetical protein
MSLELLLEAVCMTAPNAYLSIHTASINMFQQTADYDLGGRKQYCVKTIRDLCMCACVGVDFACTLKYLLFLNSKKCFRNAGCLSRYQKLFS